MATVINGIVSLTVTAIVFSQVLMPTLVSTNTSAWDTSAGNLWSTTQIIAVVGFVILILAVFGI